MGNVVASFVVAISLSYFVSTATSTSCAESGRCCQDGVSVANDSFLTGCPNQSSSVDCAYYLQDVEAAQSSRCMTTTDCLAFTCVYEFKKASFFFRSLAIDWILNAECQGNISGLLRVRVPTEAFTWTHQFVGNASVLVEGLRWRWNGVFPTDVYVKVQLFSVGGSVSFGVWLQSVVLVTTNSAYLLWSREYIPPRLLPVNVSQCKGNDTVGVACPGCQDTCIRSLYRHDRGTCYKCPTGDCLSTSGHHHVCGSNRRTYSKECLLRKEACKLGQEIHVEYPGGCTDLYPTPYKIVTSWPSSYDNLTQETISFINYAVVYIRLEISKENMSLYNKLNLKHVLSQSTGYNILVSHISSEISDSVNLTLYGSYHSSEGQIIPGYQLLDTARKHSSSIKLALSSQVLSADRPWGSSCMHEQRLFSSPQCLDYMQLGSKVKSPSRCTTTTNCHQMNCLFKFQRITSEVTVTFHKCAHPVSVDIRFQIHQLDFSWQGQFTSNASVIIPRLNVTDAGLTVQICLILELFSVNWEIYFSATTDPIVVAGSGETDPKLISIFRKKVLPLGLVPLDTAECVDPPSRGCCPDCNDSCLWGVDGGTHCYVCPLASCLLSHFPVCGEDFVTYDNECLLRRNACHLGQQIRLDYSGPCRDVRPTPDYHPITEWPARVEDVPPEFQAFIKATVLFVLVNLPEVSASSYTRSFFEAKFSESTGYRVIVPFMSVVRNGRSERHSGETVHVNVTIYAQYVSSENTTVPSVELLDVINSVEANIEVAINADIISVRQSYESVMPVPADEDDSMSSGVLAAIVIVCLVALAMIVTLVVFIWWKRTADKSRVKSGNSGNRDGTMKDDVVCLAESDQVSTSNAAYASDGSSNKN